MLFSLILGIILGAVSIVFALQNVSDVTVSLLDWQTTAPLATILLSTLAVGIMVTLLVLLPSLIRDEVYLKTIQRQKREAEDELAKYRVGAVEGPTPTESASRIETVRVVA